MVLCATLDGETRMHLWSADSLASLLMVRDKCDWMNGKVV